MFLLKAHPLGSDDLPVPGKYPEAPSWRVIKTCSGISLNLAIIPTPVCRQIFKLNCSVRSELLT